MPDPIACDLAAAQPYSYAVDNGAVSVEIFWEWDGASTFPDCDGPLLSIRVVNDTDVTYYCNLPAKKKGLRNFAIQPRSAMTYTAQQLSTAGLNTYSDTIGITPHRTAVDLAK